jgi:hypothetical protein
MRTYLQNVYSKKGWRCGSSCRVPALQVQSIQLGLSSNPSATKKKKKKKKKGIIVSKHFFLLFVEVFILKGILILYFILQVKGMRRLVI